MQKKPVFVFFLLLLAMTIPSRAQSAGHVDSNKRVAQAFFEEVIGQGKLEKYSESHSADFVAHGANHDYTSPKIWPQRATNGQPCRICRSR